MQVRCIRSGYYDRVYVPGDVFELVDDSHLGSWMDPVNAADRVRLADRLKAFGRNRQLPAAPGTPPTTGPGITGGLRDRIRPQAPVVDAKPDAKPKG